MKTNILKIFIRPIGLLGIMLTLFSCEEVPVVVQPALPAGNCRPAGEAQVAGQEKQVLIEEFTGVRCVNCPDGSQAIKELIDQHGDRLVVLGLHAGFFADPYPESQYDFRTPAGDALLNFHGSPFGYPAAIIGRRPFGNSDRLHLGQNLWAGAIAQQLAEEPDVKIHLGIQFDSLSRQLDIQTSLFFQNTVEGEVRLSLMITEDKIVDYQETPSGLQADYQHNHNLRTALTAPTGNILTDSTEGGSNFCKSFSITLPEEWVANNCKVIAFVHEGGDEKEVLQAHQTSIK